MARLEQLQALLEQEPGDAFTRYAIGLEYAKAGKFEDAIRTLEELREQAPEYVPTYYMLAGYYRKANDRESAKLIYQEGIVQARKASDRHAQSELQAALDELEDETE